MPPNFFWYSNGYLWIVDARWLVPKILFPLSGTPTNQHTSILVLFPGSGGEWGENGVLKGHPTVSWPLVELLDSVLLSYKRVSSVRVTKPKIWDTWKLTKRKKNWLRARAHKNKTYANFSWNPSIFTDILNLPLLKNQRENLLSSWFPITFCYASKLFLVLQWVLVNNLRTLVGTRTIFSGLWDTN